MDTFGLFHIITSSLQVISPVPFSPINMGPGESPVNPGVWGGGVTPGGHPAHPQAMYAATINPTTANIIANQSQDYIDEKLAEFQEQIHRLQGM